jgi:hypothetical protein
VPSGGSPASLRGCIASITTLITNRGEDAAKQYLVFILSEMMCCLDWSTQGPHGLGVNRPEIKLSIVIPANAGQKRLRVERPSGGPKGERSE